MSQEQPSRSERWLGVSSFADASRKLRTHVLAPSGGWVFDVTSNVSDATGLWDVIIVSAIFVLGWATLRLSPKEISLVLGNVFDVTIPLQHQLSENSRVQEIHQSHLAGYWPAFYCGLAVEAAGYFLVHPDLFTLVVCVKTTILTVLWMARTDGKFLTSKWYKARAGGGSSSGASPPGNSSSNKKKEWADKLREKGYASEEGIKGMVDALANLPEKDQERSLQKMLKASDSEVADRNRKWANKAKGDGRSSSRSRERGNDRAETPGRSDSTASDTSVDPPPVDTSRRTSGDEPPSSRTSGRRHQNNPAPPASVASTTPTSPSAASTTASSRAAGSADTRTSGWSSEPVKPVPGNSRWPRRDRPRNALRGNMTAD